MSAELQCLIAAALESAVVDGALPLPPPGRVRVLGQTLSQAATRAFHASAAQWRNESKAARASGCSQPWARVLHTPALRDCLAKEADILTALGAHLSLSSPNAALPADVAVHEGVEVFRIEEDDDRELLRGQRGVRAREPLPAGEVIGCLRCNLLSVQEYNQLAQQQAGAGAEAQATRELALASFRHDLTHFNELQLATAAASDVPQDAPSLQLCASAHGEGNIVALVNDGRAVQLPGSAARRGVHARPNNCVLLEVLVRGWPLLALVTLHPLTLGEELLADYGDAHWERHAALYDRLHALRSSAPVSAAGDAAAAAGAALSTPRTGGGSGRGVAAALPAADGGSGGVRLAEAAATSAGASDSASCGRDEPAPYAVAERCAPSWALFGSCTLLMKKDATESVVCVVVAQAALPASAQQLTWTLEKSRLVVASLSKGADMAAALTPLPPRCERAPVVLAPAPSADAAARKQFANLVKRLAAIGKAGRCEAAAAGGRAAYLLPPCAFADAQLAAAGVRAPAEPPWLLMLVLAPQPPRAAAPPAPVPAPPASAALLPSMPAPHESAAAAAAPPAPAAALQHAPGLSWQQRAHMPASGVDRAAELRDAAAAALEAADAGGVLPLAELSNIVIRPYRIGLRSGAWPTQVRLQAALQAAPERFQLVPWCERGNLVFGVYLLRVDAAGKRVRVAKPPALSAADATFAQQLLELLRAHAQWVPFEVLTHWLPPPPGVAAGVDAVAYVQRIAKLLPDDIGTHFHFRYAAALQAGVPPGAKPNEVYWRQYKANLQRSAPVQPTGRQQLTHPEPRRERATLEVAAAPHRSQHRRRSHSRSRSRSRDRNRRRSSRSRSRGRSRHESGERSRGRSRHGSPPRRERVSATGAARMQAQTRVTGFDDDDMLLQPMMVDQPPRAALACDELESALRRGLHA